MQLPQLRYGGALGNLLTLVTPIPLKTNKKAPESHRALLYPSYLI
jgi:hypothetical protein